MQGRCETHDLAVGPDGRCVLCRRTAPPPELIVVPRWIVVAAGVVLLAGAVVVASILSVEGDASSFAPERAVATPVAAAPAEGPPARRPHRWEVSPPEEESPTIEANALVAEPVDPSELEADVEAGRIDEAMRAARRRVSVTMYSTSWCPHCQRARDYLRSRGIGFIEHDVDQSDSAKRRMRQINPAGGVPTIQIDDELMVGFSESGFEARMARAADQRARRMVGL
jgi:glutaredoxin